MSDPFYVSEVEVEKIEGVRRRATLSATDVAFELGVHGPIRSHYGLEDQPNLPLPVDYVVASAAA